MKIILALDNIRSTYNVGSLLRSSLGFDISGVVTIGITPHMMTRDDLRLPHVVKRAEKEISKTALGGETLLKQHFNDAQEFLNWIEETGATLISIEKTHDSTRLEGIKPTSDTCVVVVGNEVDGVSKEILQSSTHIAHIPMSPHKESFNVSVAGAIALYVLTRQSDTLK